VPLIAEFEGFRSHPYQDSAGVWTIGFGFTYTPDMRRVTAATPPMTRGAATAWLQTFVAKTLVAVRQMTYAPITDAQAGALCSFAYNEGTARLHDSSIMALLNQGEPAAAADYFMSYIYAGGKPNDGLRNRRMREMALFLTGVKPVQTASNYSNPIPGTQIPAGGTHQNPAIPAASSAKTAPEEITSPEPTTDDLNARSLAGTFTPSE
jgi:lysozyme